MSRKKTQEPHASVERLLAQKDHDASFNETMRDVRKRLPRSTRWFSSLIHQPNIERSSELLGKTVARPNAILFGGISAFAVVLSLYGYAKYAGFQLQGSETIVAFVAGWLIGLAFDAIKSVFSRHR